LRLKALALLAVVLLQAAAPAVVLAQEGGEAPPIYANMIHFPGDRIVGVCYPWVVFAHNFLDLSTWTFTPGIGGDEASSVSCGDKDFVVVGVAGVYLVSKDTGAIIQALPIAGNTRFIGRSGGFLAFLFGEEKVVVRTPFQGDMVIPLQLDGGRLRDIKFGAVSGHAFVAYIVEAQGSVSLRYSTPVRTVTVATLSPASSALYIHGGFIIVENDGVEAYEVVDPSLPTIRKLPGYSLYLPFDIASFVKGDLDEFYLYTTDWAVIKLDLQSRRWSYLGQGVVTDAGIFVYNWFNPARSTTYVTVRGVVHPVPGFAVARIGNLVFTNILSEDGSVEAAVLYPTERSVLVSTRSLDGVLLVTDDSGEVRPIRLRLAPGTYILPRGSTIATDMGMIVLDKDEVFYPPPIQETHVLPASPVRYMVLEFPRVYQVLDAFEGVVHVSSGGGKLLIVMRDRAVVYAPYGVVTVIPGVWRWGGISDHVVLYDGATLRVYDAAGNPKASYATFIVEEPLQAQVVKTSKGYDVHLLFSRQYVVVNGSGVFNVPDYHTPRKEDKVSGLMVTLHDQPEVRYGVFTFRIPSADRVEVNMYAAAWTQGNTWFVLEVPLMTVYVFLNAPSAVIYPLGDYLAILANATLRVVPFKSWIVSACFVDIEAPPFAEIYVDGRRAGNGSMRFYAECGRRVSITATAEYHSPDTVSVTVPPGGVRVALAPKPKLSLVKLQVLAPRDLPVEAVEVEVDGERMVWNVGEAKSFVAEMPHEIYVVSFKPYDVCRPQSFSNVRFKEGEDTFVVPCQLVGSVLGIKSGVPVLVAVLTEEGEPVMTAQVMPGVPVFTPARSGFHILKSRAVEGKYVERNLTVFIPEGQVVVVDVTPLPYGRLVVRAVPETALIQVMDWNGTLVGEGTGELAVDVLPGFYQVAATAPGYLQYFEVVEVPAGETREVVAALTPQPPATTPAPTPIWEIRLFQVLAILAVLAAAAIAVLWRRRRAAREVGGEILEAGR